MKRQRGEQAEVWRACRSSASSGSGYQIFGTWSDHVSRRIVHCSASRLPAACSITDDHCILRIRVSSWIRSVEATTEARLPPAATKAHSIISVSKILMLGCPLDTDHWPKVNAQFGGPGEVADGDVNAHPGIPDHEFGRCTRRLAVALNEAVWPGARRGSGMGYVENDKPDIFLSYARVDDEPLDGPIGWVTELSRKLKKLVDAKLGNIGDCEIFMDHELATGAYLSRALEAKIRGSALLLTVYRRAT